MPGTCWHHSHGLSVHVHLLCCVIVWEPIIIKPHPFLPRFYLAVGGGNECGVDGDSGGTEEDKRRG